MASSLCNYDLNNQQTGQLIDICNRKWTNLSLVFQKYILLYGADLLQFFAFDRTSEVLIVGCIELCWNIIIFLESIDEIHEPHKECQDDVHKTML